MKQRTASRLAWSVVVIAVVLLVPATWLAFLNGGDEPRDVITVLVVGMPFAVIGLLIASRFPRNPLGWIFIAVAFLQVVENLTYEYALFSVTTRDAALPGTGFAAWVAFWAWMPSIGLMITFLFLLFPHGRLPSSRWRWVAWAAGIGIGLVVLGVAIGAASLDPRLLNAEPTGFPEFAELMVFVGGPMVLVAAIGSVASLVVRFRRSRGEERQQLKWIAYASAFALIVTALQFLPIESVPSYLEWLFPVAILSLPVAAGIAILRYRLYDIDVVINKALVYGALAVFITGVYLGLVVGIGAAIGSRGNPVLSILATAVIAVGFQPVRERARRFANRLVYGKRATPYEVLSEFSERVGGTYDLEDVLPRMARTLGEGTGASRAEVWLRVGQEIRRTAVWPSTGEAEVQPVLLDDGAFPEIPSTDRAVPVRHRGELLGALAMTKSANDPVTPAEEKLLTDLASHAGLVLRNVRLTAELEGRLEDLRASRQRIVSAQDEERRRLERNIHDGAQQQLVALAVKLNLVEALAAKDPAKATTMTAQAKVELQDALDNLRDLARGIYPPLLADKGLAAALEAQARKAPVPVAVEPDGIGRYPQEAEAAAYFCVLEALQNVSKYAQASRATVRLSHEDGDLVFTVTDDGKGFDPATTRQGSGLQNMADRVEALGGSVDVASSPGTGTTVTGRIPIATGVGPA